MGYDLHVTRGDSQPIAETEWRAYVAGDPELDLTGVAEASAPDGTLRYENPGLACWRGHPSGEQVWFDFRLGRLVVKNPDEPTIAKMLALADALGARVDMPGHLPLSATICKKCGVVALRGDTLRLREILPR
jgi:hypothetical protein